MEILRNAGEWAERVGERENPFEAEFQQNS
jgi:hypothetical protein